MVKKKKKLCGGPYTVGSMGTKVRLLTVTASVGQPTLTPILISPASGATLQERQF